MKHANFVRDSDNRNERRSNVGRRTIPRQRSKLKLSVRESGTLRKDLPTATPFSLRPLKRKGGTRRKLSNVAGQRERELVNQVTAHVNDPAHAPRIIVTTLVHNSQDRRGIGRTGPVRLRQKEVGTRALKGPTAHQDRSRSPPLTRPVFQLQSRSRP